MSAPSVIQGNVHVIGQLSASSMALPASVISNNNVADNAAIAADKLEQQINKHLQRAVPAAETATIHIANATGYVFQLSAMCRTVPAATKSYTVDLKKNGTTILTAPITFNNSSTPLTRSVATLASDEFAASDILSITITDVAGGTLGTDLIVELIVREAPIAA